MGDHNKQIMMTSNETRLTIAIADLIISEVISFNLAQKPRFKDALDLAKMYQNFIEIMERNLSLIMKEYDIFGFLFLGDGATISRIPLLNILV